jgi:DNA-binding GntR family transcriptional regulator
LPDSLFQQIRTAILEGTYPPGTPLVEVQLAAEFAVSRTPVREALTRLEQDGIVERSDRGLQVRRRTPEEILDIYDVRASLESLAARTAAERHTRLDAAKLRRAFEACRDLDPSASADERVGHNNAYHQTIWRSTHNDYLQDQLERLSGHLARFPATTLMQPGRWEHAMREHEAIYDAIIDRDGERAAAAAAAHFVAAREVRLTLYENESI